MFLQEYQTWWDRRSQNQPLSLQWTVLLFMVCACAAQHLDVEMKPVVEIELGESSEKLSKDYHEAAQELGRVIPAGHCHLLNLQWMLHSIYWFKAEARFVEAWHVIGAAVREAHELGENLWCECVRNNLLTSQVFIELPLQRTCPSLTRRCEEESGVYWIAGIGKPSVLVLYLYSSEIGNLLPVLVGQLSLTIQTSTWNHLASLLRTSLRRHCCT